MKDAAHTSLVMLRRAPFQFAHTLTQVGIFSKNNQIKGVFHPKKVPVFSIDKLSNAKHCLSNLIQLLTRLLFHCTAIICHSGKVLNNQVPPRHFIILGVQIS